MNRGEGSGPEAGRPAVRARVVRAVVEFTVIVVGVPVALAVDQWAEDRSERELERGYVARLIEDLERDRVNYHAWHALLEESPRGQGVRAGAKWQAAGQGGRSHGAPPFESEE